jgi:hypothetical protein
MGSEHGLTDNQAGSLAAILVSGVLFISSASCGSGVTSHLTSAECGRLYGELNAEYDAFSPKTSNACASDSDCAIGSNLIARNGRACLGSCGVIGSVAWTTEFKNYLDTDESITRSCEVFGAGGCVYPTASCILLIPKCVSGVCKQQE